MKRLRKEGYWRGAGWCRAGEDEGRRGGERLLGWQQAG
jgi:hypothetical protein